MNLSEPTLPESRTLEEIYARHHRMLAVYTASLMRDMPDEVEDVLQNVYLRVIRHQESITQMNDLGVRIYLRKIAENEVWRFRRWKLPRLKQQIPLDEVDELLLPDDCDPAAEVCDTDNYRTIVRLIRTMPATYRDILYLRFLCHLTLRQIADQFGMSYHTVQKRFERGRALLIEQIERSGVIL
jgi:RNA polymerase sigma-70 factor (ECF subfamily)